MLRLLAAVAVAVLLVAGCAEPSEPTVETAGPAGLSAEAFTGSGTVVAGEEGVILLPIGEVCGVPTSQCQDYPFEVTGTNGSLAVRATLAWTVPANDFDLHLLGPDGRYIHMDMGPPPADSVSWEERLSEPGTYVVRVVPFTTAADSFELTVAFAD